MGYLLIVLLGQALLGNAVLAGEMANGRPSGPTTHEPVNAPQFGLVCSTKKNFIIKDSFGKTRIAQVRCKMPAPAQVIPDNRYLLDSPCTCTVDNSKINGRVTNDAIELPH